MCPNSILSTPLDRSRRAEQNGMVGDRTEDLDFGLQAKNFARDLGYMVIKSDSSRFRKLSLLTGQGEYGRLLRW